jgi:hypothetical protein
MIPTLSQIEVYTTDHLVDAADHWDGLADRWEDAHWQVRNQAHALDWQGVAGDALRARTASDYIVAADHADLPRGTSRIARQQAGELQRLRNRVLYAVDDAHNAGFTVGEDLSVTDTRTSRTTAELAARQAQAQVFAADIRSRAGALVGADTEVAGNLTAAAAGVGTTPFIEKPPISPKATGRFSSPDSEPNRIRSYHRHLRFGSRTGASSSPYLTRHRRSSHTRPAPGARRAPTNC